MKIIYSQQSGSITNATGSWQITAAPVLGFTFDGLFYDDDNGIVLKYMGAGRTDLSASEIAMVKQFLTLAVMPVPTPLTPTEQQAIIVIPLELAVSDYIEGVAKARGYDGILSCSKYVAFANQWQSECLALLQWNANVWNTCHTIEANVIAGTAAIPASAAALISQLPTPP